ncbi:hypothetical protein ACEPAI_2318 [Sanghuangporus weigelae]
MSPKRSIQLYPEDAHELTTFKSILVACTTFHFYYTALHLHEEVEYIWSNKWTFGKAMYLLSRYLGAFFLICSVIGVHSYAWNDPVNLRSYPVVNNVVETCLNGNLFSGVGPMIILVAEMILMMRVYALYGRSKKLLVFFAVLTTILFTFDMMQFFYSFFTIEENDCDASGGCIESPFVKVRDELACMKSLPMAAFGWAITSFVELLLCLLVVFKAGNWERIRCMMHKSNSQPSPTRDVTTAMARDSVAYFAIIFTVCSVGTVIAFTVQFRINDITSFIYHELNAYETIVITLVTILAPNLILNLRMAYYGPPEDGSTYLSWNVQVPTLSTTDRGLEDLYARDDLETFVD